MNSDFYEVKIYIYQMKRSYIVKYVIYLNDTFKMSVLHLQRTAEFYEKTLLDGIFTPRPNDRHELRSDSSLSH